jgi:hypothetical protein
MSTNFRYIWKLLLLLYSCYPKEKEVYRHEFPIKLSPFASVTDCAVSEKGVFILTNKHELLEYTFYGEKTRDTVILKPKLFPDNSVEFYPENHLRSMVYFDNSCYFLGQNPSDLYKIDLSKNEIKKTRVKLHESGVHYLFNSTQNEPVIQVNDVVSNDNDLILYHLDLGSMEVKRIIKESLGFSQTGTFLYKKNNALRVLNPSQNGYIEISESGEVIRRDSFFLDSILDKSRPKRVMELSEFYGMATWERNQYQSDLILSAISVDQETDYFLIKKLNRTSAAEKDFKIVLARIHRDNVDIKELADYVFCKFDQNTKTFCGITFDSKFVITADIDKLLFGQNEITGFEKTSPETE